MKKIQLIILLAITFCNSFAQQLHEIKLKDATVSVTGDRLNLVAGKKNVWEIDLKTDEEVFKLISENKKKVDYVLNGKFVLADDTYRQTIPYLKDNKNFYNSARLVLKRESLPITISANGNVVATFQLKMKYQEFEIPKKNVFYVGDTLRIIKKDNPKNGIPINKFSFQIKNNNKIIEIKDSIIREDLLGSNDSISNCQIICVAEYNDAHKETKETKNIIKIKSYKDETNYIIISSIIILLVSFGGIYFWRQKKHIVNTKSESAHGGSESINKGNGNESPHIDIPTKYDSLESYQVDHTSASNETGADVLIKENISQINTQKSRIAELESMQDVANISELQDRIKELEESENAKLDEIEELSAEKNRLVNEKNDLQARLDEITSDNVSKKELRNKIEELKDEKNKLIREKQNKERELVDARKSITNLESKVKEKEDKITEINRQKDEAESNLRIEKNSTAVLQKKISSFSKQTYYLYAIDDAMQAVDSSLKHLFTDVCDENLMKRLAQPILSGTAGLDLGLESYLNEWKSSVYDNQNRFFGDDVLNMTDDSVKEKLAEFLEQLALRDSFGKLVRLYTMTNVGWINEQMVKTGFNVDAIQTIFARFKNLLALFNIAISYPRLFVDKFDPNRHKDNMRCEIFNYFEPSVELLAQLKTRENENLIVDVTRIGIPNSKIPARRNAMVSLPNF